MKTILSIEPYYITEKELCEIGEEHKNRPSYHFFNELPEWCIREDNGRIDRTEYYHQFTGQSLPEDASDNGYLFFNMQPADVILQEEILNVGFEQFFVETDFRPLFEKIKLNLSPFHMVSIPETTHLIVDLNYEGSYEDVELFVTLVGYLDYELNKCKL